MCFKFYSFSAPFEHFKFYYGKIIKGIMNRYAALMRLVRGQFCFLAWGTSLVSLLLTL